MGFRDFYAAKENNSDFADSDSNSNESSDEADQEAQITNNPSKGHRNTYERQLKKA